MHPDTEDERGIGCSALTWASLALVIAGAVLWTVGILLEGPERCSGLCEWSAFTLIFAGAPVSALITVAGGSDLVLAWPLDVLAWIMIGIVHTRRSGETAPFSPRWNRTTVAIVGVALVYGAMLALFVEQAG